MLEFRVEFPTDEGFLGRECPADECGRYFRVHMDSMRDEMHCPYCGVLVPNDELWTQDQLNHMQNVVEREATEFVQDQLSRMLKDVARKSDFLEYKPGKRHRKPRPEPKPERTVDTELTCPDCDMRFQVDGIFGFCPGCASENALLYDANLKVIKQEVTRADNPERALRHAYADLVSTFETFCRREAERHDLGPARFQNLDSVRKLFRDEIDVDIFADLTQVEKRCLKRVFQKRHLYEHYRGIVNDRYVEKIPEDESHLGMKAPLSTDELDAAADLLGRALRRLVDART